MATYPILTFLDLKSFEKFNIEEELYNPNHPPNFENMTFIRLDNSELLNLESEQEWNSNYNVEYLEDYMVHVGLNIQEDFSVEVINLMDRKDQFILEIITNYLTGIYPDIKDVTFGKSSICAPFEIRITDSKESYNFGMVFITKKEFISYLYGMVHIIDLQLKETT